MLTVVNHQNQDKDVEAICARILEAIASRTKGQRIIANKVQSLSFLQHYLTTLDRSSQIIIFHRLSGFEIKLTSVVTSLSEAQIENCYEYLARSMFEYIKTFDFNVDNEKDFSQLLLLSKYLQDIEIEEHKIAETFKLELAVVKILRKLALSYFNYGISGEVAL